MVDHSALLWAWVGAALLVAPCLVIAARRDAAQRRETTPDGPPREGCIGSAMVLAFDIVYYALAALVLIPVSFVGRLLRRPRPSGPAATESPVELDAPTSQPTLSRQQVRERLVALAATNPTPVAPSSDVAMCYAPACPPERAEYVCPACGARTVLTDSRAAFAEWILPTLRRQVTRLSALAATLEERGMCAACAPHRTARCDLLLRFEGEARPRRFPDITSADLLLLTEFLDGSDLHATGLGGATPLRDHLARLQTLLGTDLPETEDAR